MRYTDANSIKSALAILDREYPRVTSVLSIFGGGKKLSKAQRKKLARRRYRMFVDNIIMHHRRLHEQNREMTVKMAKEIMRSYNKPKKQAPGKHQTRALASRSKPKTIQKSPDLWRDRAAIRERTKSIRGLIDLHRTRARSRWVSVVGRSRMEDGRDHTIYL